MRRKKWMTIGLVLLGAVGLFFLPCVRQVRNGEARIYSAVSLNQIGIALQGYHDTHGHLPPAVVRDRDGRPLYSWRVLILPYVEDEATYRKFRLDEPWDGPNNKLLLQTTPRAFQPVVGYYPDPLEGRTRFQAVVGPCTAFERDGLTRSDFPDGLAETVLVVEAEEAVPWSAPVDFAYDPTGEFPAFHKQTKPVKLSCRELWRHDGFVALMGTGQARFIRMPDDERDLRALMTRNGGEAVATGLID